MSNFIQIVSVSSPMVWLQRLQAHTKVFFTEIQNLLFTDDCAHTLDTAQQFFDQFAKASNRFGLTVSLKKTEVLLQPLDKKMYSTPVIWAGGAALKSLDRFCYLGCLLSNAANIDDEISAKIAKASAAFGRLTKRLWDDHGIRVATKVAPYKAIVLTALLYDCESWTLYHRHIAKLD